MTAAQRRRLQPAVTWLMLGLFGSVALVGQGLHLVPGHGHEHDHAHAHAGQGYAGHWHAGHWHAGHWHVGPQQQAHSHGHASGDHAGCSAHHRHDHGAVGRSGSHHADAAAAVTVAATGCTGEGDEAVSAMPGGHDDCPVCRFLAQSRLAANPPPAICVVACPIPHVAARPLVLAAPLAGLPLARAPPLA